MSEAIQGPVAVIGAGIVGVCTALQLQQAGVPTVLIDSAEPGSGCSSGNAGILADCISGTVASPSVLRSLPKLAFGRSSPVTVRWGYLPQLAPWLIQFLKACTPERSQANTRNLAALVTHARAAYIPLFATSGAGTLVTACGALHAYETEAGVQGAASEVQIRQAQRGKADLLSADELRGLEPSLSSHILGGMLRPEVRLLLDPQAFTQSLEAAFKTYGGRFIRHQVQRLERTSDGGWEIIGSGTEPALRFERVVVAAGGRSGQLLETAGAKVLLDVERGFHFDLPYEAGRLTRPVFCTEGGFCMSPMRDRLRIAGTVELGGIDSPILKRQANRMLARAQGLLPGLNTGDAQFWTGCRPSMPDSLPVIGEITGHKGLIGAFGHGHLGMTLGAITGRLITQLITGKKPELDLHPYRSDRFD